MHIWLRNEDKEGERRTPLTAAGAKALLDAKHSVTVEQSSTRCIKDGDYEDVGCKMVPSGSWKKGIEI